MILLLRMHSRAHCQARFAASSPYNGFVPCGIRSGSTSIFPPTYSFKHSNQCFVRSKYTLPSGLKFPQSEYLICTIVKALRGGRRETAAKRVVANKTLQSLDLGWIGSEFSTKGNVMQTFGTFIVCTVLDFFYNKSVCVA